jgi:copper resistance protein B
VSQPNLEPDKEWPSPVDDKEWYTFFLTEILEHRSNEGDDSVRWDVYGWHGGDYNRLWVKSEGSASTAETSGEGEIQLLYGRLVSRYFDFQAGLRLDHVWGDDDETRGLLAVGVQGLAPYYFDLEPTLFVGDEGEVSARFTGTYDILITQRLILQPRLEGNVAVQDRKDFGVGSGVNNFEAGLRLRYELRREIAPYIGVNYGKLFGETADLAREDGEDPDEWSFVSGLRLWF